MAHINVCSLRRKLDQIRHIISKHDYDIFGVSETWLDCNIPDSELGIDGYTLFRKDRNSGRGGGVCVYVKCCHDVILREDLMIDDVDAIWIEIMVGKINYLISVVYRPPSAHADYYEKILDMLDKVETEEKDNFIMGDLNFDYKLDESLSSNPLYYIENAYGYTQMITEVTRKTAKTESIIDVLLTSNPELHTKSGTVKYALSDHYLIQSIITLPSKNACQVSQSHNEVSYRDFKQFDHHSFTEDIKNANEQFVKLDNDITWEMWKNKFLDICNKHVPLIKVRLKTRKNPWITPDIVKMMYERDHLHARAVKYGDPILMDSYRKLRNRITSEIEKKKFEHFSNMNNVCKRNPRKIWEELKSVLPDKINFKSIPKNLNADTFNKYFVDAPQILNSKFPKEPEELYWKGSESIYTFKFKEITAHDVMKYFSNLPDKSGGDVLGFDRKLLEIAAPYIAESLCLVINMSLASGCFHDDWKFARVTPVYKQAGNINFPGNYRPISVIGHIAKMIESLIGVQMINYLEEHNFISTDQSAYLKRHSTITSLHRVIDDWLESMNDDMLIGAVFYDISKCFDTINHDLLLKKMFKYGFRGNEQLWFKSYLNYRKQKVNINGQQSSFLLIADGVPQGSVLGPLLFLLFINDISNFTTDDCSLNLFADDSISYVAAHNISELQMKLQKCVDSISQWYLKNRLTVNASKCKMMVIGTSARLKMTSLDDLNVMYEGNPLDLVEKTKYLGLHLSSDLNWDTHIMEICKQLNYYLHLLRRLKRVLPRDLLMTVYKAYFQSKFDYGISVWGCTTQSNIQKIQRMQNRAARIITGCYDFINIRGIDLVNELNLQNITERRDYFLCNLMFKAIHGLAPTYLSDSIIMNADMNEYSTRGAQNRNVYQPRPRIEKYKNSFLYKAGELWNALPVFVKESLDLEMFKRNYKAFKGGVVWLHFYVF